MINHVSQRYVTKPPQEDRPLIRDADSNRVGWKSLEAQLSLLRFPPPQLLVVSKAFASRETKREFRDSTAVQQQGKRCRWSKSLVNSDRLFIFLHKHNHLFSTHVCVLQSTSLFERFLESISFIATNCYNYVI